MGGGEHLLKARLHLLPGGNVLANIPVQLNPGETLLHTSEGAHLKSTLTGLGFNPYRGQGWVTDQRLVFAHYKGRSTSEILFVESYPLHRIQTVSIIRKKIRFIPNAAVLKLEFDNRGREYFWLDDPSIWAEVIRKAKPTAPEMPYTTLPPIRTGVEASAWTSFFVMLAVAAGILLCSALGCGLLAVLVYGNK